MTGIHAKYALILKNILLFHCTKCLPSSVHLTRIKSKFVDEVEMQESAEAAKKPQRFKAMSEEDLLKLEEHRQSVSTKRNTKWGINLFAGT